MTKDINSSVFTPETQLKLQIFRDCFKEWFPVFANAEYPQCLYIYDFFAGSGYDSENEPGSPIILLEEASAHCPTIKNKNKIVHFTFNELDPEKYELLNQNTLDHIERCKEKHNCSQCVLHSHTIHRDFSEEFQQNENIQAILRNKDYAKFIILDQYGFKYVDENVFNTLINSPRTDFIFFITSSYISRFREHPVVKRFLGNSSISFDETKPKECHKIIADYFELLIPHDKEYYLNHFTIKKKSNYYGLIMGTSHTLGMEKFQRACWKEDPLAGESNCNTQDDFVEGELFYDPKNTNKKSSVKQKIEMEILSSQIQDNISGLKRALQLRCQPNLFVEVMQKLEKEGRVIRNGDKTNKSTNIHQIKPNGKDYYTITVIK